MSPSCWLSSSWRPCCFRSASGPNPTCWRASPPACCGAPPSSPRCCRSTGCSPSDYEDGTLDLLLLAPWPLELAALAKCLAHWIVTGLPLAVLAPFLGIAFGLDGPSLLALAATLLVGTPTLSLIGGLAAALTLGARRSGALLALLALPLCVPTLIFGAGAIETMAMGENFTTHLAILAALALVALATTPWAMAAALRQAGE